MTRTEKPSTSPKVFLGKLKNPSPTMAVYKITKPPRHTPGKLEIEYRPNQFLDILYESGQEQTKAKAFCEALLAKQGHYELYIEL